MTSVVRDRMTGHGRLEPYAVAAQLFGKLTLAQRQIGPIETLPLVGGDTRPVSAIRLLEHHITLGGALADRLPKVKVMFISNTLKIL